MSNLLLAFRIARRELRGGLRALRIVLACLALGVAAITAVGTLRAGVDAGLAADGARILGGDVEIASPYRPLAEAPRAWLAARGARVSEVVTLRAMAVAETGQRMLVEVKAVDGAYPLFGTLELQPPVALGAGDILLDPFIAERLGVAPGAMLRIGEARFTFRATIAQEPDKVASPSLLGPRAMITLASLEATRLILPGSLVTYEYRLALPPGVDRQRFIADLRRDFPESGWRIRSSDVAAPGVNRFLDRAAFFLTLASLTALLVGGIGIATGVSAWLEQRARTIATLRCLGAPPSLIFTTYLMQVMALALLGIALGLVIGFGLTWAGAAALASILPVAPRILPYPMPLAMAALYGLLTALAFTLWPLGRAGSIPGAALFRDVVAPSSGRPSLGILAAILVSAAALSALVIGTAENPRFAAMFIVAVIGTLLLFRLGAGALMAIARRLPHARRPALRLGLANLHRPGAPTPLMLVSLGMGLTVLSAIALIEGNLRRQLADEMPAAAPNFYFIDIQSDQMQAFEALARAQPGVTEIRSVPNLRARIVAVNGVPAEQVNATPETAWALRGDRGLTYAARPPEGAKLVAGEWWAPDYAGPPLVSFDAQLAKGWGVGVGDSITVNVLGRDITLKIASLREIAWRGLGINYVLVASPGLLSAAPHTHIATMRNDVAQEATLLRLLTDRFPNVSGIRVRDALDQVVGLLEKIGFALSAVAGITLLAGLLVLAGAVAAGQRRRIRDAVVLKTIGATRAQIRASFLVEFGLLGLTAGLLAAAAGTAAAWGVVRFVMRADWVFLPGTLALTVLACMAVTLAFGYAGTAFALRAKAAPLLRNE
ncbi:MAG: FtsX-like permease family protein [Acetobacteraceae bacterium]|nr:FtsX-like permease family protein [Acetobacteraceae bacterium]